MARLPPSLQSLLLDHPTVLAIPAFLSAEPDPTTTDTSAHLPSIGCLPVAAGRLEEVYNMAQISSAPLSHQAASASTVVTEHSLLLTGCVCLLSHIVPPSQKVAACLENM